MIVDDDDVIAVGLKEFLQLRGYGVETSRDYENARKAMSRCAYEVAFVDVMVTGQSPDAGMAFLRWVRETFPDIVVIVITAYRTPWLSHLVLSLGIAPVIDKPVAFEDLADLILRSLRPRAHSPGESLV